MTRTGRLAEFVTAVVVAGLGLALWPHAAPGQAGGAAADYEVEVDRQVASVVRDGARLVTLQFRVKSKRDGAAVTDLPKEEIVVEEDGKLVKSLEISAPKGQKLTVVLALDISGSMARDNKMEAARRAALHFLDKLDARADAGLILFDHEMKVAEKPLGRSDPSGEHRERLKGHIRAAVPQGGTAYLDATVEATKMLQGIDGRKVIVVMTDGVDMNSRATLRQAIEEGQKAEVPVYTLGIGKPGKNDPVTTVLVLDRSGSMLGKADDGDELKKIDALKVAAKRFVQLIRPGSRTTLLPFSSTIDRPEDFTDDKKALEKRIESLRPGGGTLLYDSTFAGIETLMAGNLKGNKAVVVLTDGKDEAPGSRRPDTAVIERAKEAGVPLYMLGLGRPQEIAEEVMQRMARETGGEYYHAGSQKKLLEVFENLSIQLHDDGIDEVALRSLANETGGTYTHVSNIDELQFIYEKLATELQTNYRVTFPSGRAAQDGTARGIDVKVVRGGRLVSTVGTVDDVARGIVVPQVSAGVYLALLAGLLGLIAAPGALRRVFGRSAGG